MGLAGQRRLPWIGPVVLVASASGLLAPIVLGHIFIFDFQRAGVVSCEGGTGWHVECFWAIPDEYAGTLLDAEDYADKNEPTFTFHADYIDWPSGDVAWGKDSSFATMGDFLDDYISDVSDPEALNLPFDHFLLRATGFVDAQLDDSSAQPAPPVWMEFGMGTFDGGRVRIAETTIFRIVVPVPPDGFYTENAIIDLPGAYPIEITYFQKYDPDNALGADQAGVELYTCNPEGLELPNGDLVLCYADAGKGTPPSLIYPEEAVMDPIPFDFDADTDVDLHDFGYFQTCFTGPEFEGYLINGCETLDLDFDGDVDLTDYYLFNLSFTGTNGC